MCGILCNAENVYATPLHIIFITELSQSIMTKGRNFSHHEILIPLIVSLVYNIFSKKFNLKLRRLIKFLCFLLFPPSNKKWQTVKRERTALFVTVCDLSKNIDLFPDYWKCRYDVPFLQIYRDFILQCTLNNALNTLTDRIIKRYFKIDKHFARHFVYYVECLSSPPPFLCSQIIIPFLNSMISINQEKGLEF